MYTAFTGCAVPALSEEYTMCSTGELGRSNGAGMVTKM